MYVKDAVAALMALALSDVTGAYNIGTGERMRLNDVFNTLEMVLSGVIRRMPYDKSKAEPPEIIADVSKLAAIGWKPKYTLDDGLRETVEWWKGICGR
jgi:nucleoside-diphosphate-sugar epimerase